MSLLKKQIKKILFRLFKLLAKKTSVNKAIVLNYHRVTKEAKNTFDDSLDAIEFKTKMLFLKEHFNVISLPELISRANTCTIEPLTVAITFDDGYEDGYSVILPILQELDLSAAFFIATEGLEKGGLWNDCIATALNVTTKTHLENFLDLPLFDLTTLSLRQKAHSLIHKKCKFLSLSERNSAIEQLLIALEVNIQHDDFLTAQQIKTMHQAGMTIGAHTDQHPILALESEEVSFQEIKKSKLLLEKIIDQEVKYFAYPNGRKGRDFNKNHETMLSTLNFEAAFMTGWGHVTPETNMLCIPRFTPWDKDEYSFGIRLCNFYGNKFDAHN